MAINSDEPLPGSTAGVARSFAGWKTSAPRTSAAIDITRLSTYLRARAAVEARNAKRVVRLYDLRGGPLEAPLEFLNSERNLEVGVFSAVASIQRQETHGVAIRHRKRIFRRVITAVDRAGEEIDSMLLKNVSEWLVSWQRELD